MSGWETKVVGTKFSLRNLISENDCFDIQYQFCNNFGIFSNNFYRSMIEIEIFNLSPSLLYLIVDDTVSFSSHLLNC